MAQTFARAPGVVVAAGTTKRTFQEIIDARAERASDAADLVRMDDDGGL